MEFFKPKLQLWFQKELDQPGNYFLQAVTMCDRTNYRADGHFVDRSSLEGEKEIRVRLLLKKDTEFGDFKTKTPVIHTIALGQIDAHANGTEVMVIAETIDADRPLTRDGSEGNSNPPSTVGTTGANQGDRPIGDEEVCFWCS